MTNRIIEISESVNILSITNKDSLVTYVNPDLIAISGFTEQELIGQLQNIVRHPDMPPAVFSHMWETLRFGKYWMGLIRNRCKNRDHY